MRGVRLVTFLDELNLLITWTTDINNAYLEAKTKEKFNIVAGPEFGNLEGNVLVINKALYELKSSVLRWYEKLTDTLCDMDFYPSKGENDVWMRRNGEVYEYIAYYVDDLYIAAKDPKEITDTLQQKYGYKLKCTGPITYHLGCDYFRDKENNLCYAPKNYIETMILDFQHLFFSKPK